MTKSEILNTMKLLDIKEVTTPRQALNGTREFELPIKYRWGKNIRLASFKTGYVRNQNGCYSNYQLNKVIRYKEKSNRYYNYKRILIPNEIDRLEYLLKFAVRNYYTKQQVQVKKQVITIEPEVSVIVNGHRYNL
tara:strand:+ start:324 stop:728 length:405 start_codon:yes stop_codon:yes gene_type:complete